MDKKRSYAVAGGHICNGAFLPHAHGDLARAGSPKKLNPQIASHGMARQTDGKALSPYHHGVKLCDEPNTAGKLSEGKQVTVHPSMKSQTAGNGFDVLRKATDPQCFDNGDAKCHSLPNAMKR